MNKENHAVVEVANKDIFTISKILLLLKIYSITFSSVLICHVVIEPMCKEDNNTNIRDSNNASSKKLVHNN